MATYVYNCRDCEQFTEIIRPMRSEEQTPSCGECDKLMNKIYTPVPIQFKGSGFYATGG